MKNDQNKKVIKIFSFAELQEIGNDSNSPLNGYYELARDIDASEPAIWNDGGDFKPIGTDENPFTGKFDGKGHKIVGLHINDKSGKYKGLFGKIGSGGEVKNVCLVDATVSGHMYVGSLAGWNEGTVSGCYSLSSCVSSGIEVGGLVGRNTGTIINSYSKWSKVTGLADVGGLVGDNFGGTVKACYSMNSVHGDAATGGLVGINEKDGKVNECYSISFVYGKWDVGGLVGHNHDGSVSNSFAVGSVLGSVKNIGGLIGSLVSGNVTNTYSTCLVEGIDEKGEKGGLIGRAYYNCTVTSSYWDAETSKKTNSAGGEGMIHSEMKQKSTFIGWDFTNIWGIIENITYPFLLNAKNNIMTSIVKQKETQND